MPHMDKIKSVLADRSLKVLQFSEPEHLTESVELMPTKTPEHLWMMSQSLVLDNCLLSLK